ncbi:MAG: MerR family transcriptional regulator [Nitrospira sp.]|jgi:DNA-binding transcriptional MerR regulator|nr:MerR family transcriptional regulator [Nitrospira sp.]MDI3465024.1 hypothetical protein [Nitrospira sp.]
MDETTDAPTISDPILIGDVIRTLDVSTARINAFVIQGLLHPIRTPGRIRIFSRAEVEALRAARKKKRLSRMAGALAR